MAEPVIGKDVEIMFKKNDVYIPYGCAIDITITFRLTEKKTVKTIGDGNWEKPRGQKKGYELNLNGLVKYDDSAVPHVFDLYQYLDGMTPIEFLMSFTNDVGQNRFIEGLALVTEVSMGGGSTGFANGSASFEGDGPVDIRDLLVPCPSSITSIQLVEDTPNSIIRITGHTGSPARYEYSVDGGPFVPQTVTSFIQDLVLEGGLGAGLHSITIIPVCDNGYNGTPYEDTFELMGTGGGCDAPTDLVFSAITENTATANWTAPGSPPADGYYWELYLGLSFQQSGTTATTSVNLTGLTGGLTYTVKVRSVCETGVSVSGFISGTFETDAPANPTQILWSFGEEGSAAGRLSIKVNGVTEVNETNPNGGNVLMISGGDEITVDVIELPPGADIKDLYIQDLTAGTVLYNNSDANPQHFVFTAVADHVYELQSNVYNV